jgi:uncharacterized membrane protein YdjX (TVP38/TMEM64 family)
MTARQKRQTQLAIFFLVSILLGIIYKVFLEEHLTIHNLQVHHAFLKHYTERHPLQIIAGYLTIYVLISCLAFFPVAILMALTGGALFGFWPGIALVCLGSTLGATAAFLMTRHFFRDFFQRRYRKKLEPLNEEIKKDGAFYLFILRVTPIFPFAAVNLMMALTPMKAKTFFIGSFMGFLPGTAAYVNAGVQLSQIQNVKDILSPSLILSVVLLALVPLAARKSVNYFKEHHAR